MSKTKYHKGIVKKVLSGDTFVVLGPTDPEKGLPMEKRLTIYGTRAPYKINNGEFDPHRENSKENLRQLLAGKKVSFKGFKIENRVFAHVYLDDEDIALKLLSGGHVSLSKKVNPKFHPKDYGKYEGCYHKAKESGIGLHGPNPTPLAKLASEEPKSIFDEYKEQKLTGYLNNITYEFRFELFVPQFGLDLKCELLGIYIPILNGSSAKRLKVFLYKNHFHQDIHFKMINNVGKAKDIVQVIEKLSGDSLTRKLLVNGFAKLDKSSEETLPKAIFEKYTEYQKEAVTKGKGIWGGGRKRTSKSDFLAKVIEIHSGDSLTIKNFATNENIRVFLSNLRAPKVPNPSNPNDEGEAFGFEAKEYLRTTLIGKTVRAVLEYIKTIEFKRGGATQSRTMQCASIYDGDKNLSVDLLTKGYAQCFMPKDGEEHSSHILLLKETADAAKDAKVGIYSGQKPQFVRYWDLTTPANKKKVRTEFRLDEVDTLTGLIVHVYSPIRFKIRVNSKNVFIVVQLNGLKAIQHDKNMPSFSDFAAETLDYVKTELHQRPIKIDIENVDKYGNFHVSFRHQNKNFAVTLLELGYVYIDLRGRDPKYINSYRTAEQKAKTENNGLWSKQKELGIGNNANIIQTMNPFEAFATEIISPSEFYVHDAKNSKVDEIQAQIGETINKIISNPDNALQAPVNNGTWCLAEFDGSYFRAKVTRKIGDEKAQVFFVDFGNTDIFKIGDLYRLPVKFTNYAPQAIKCGLAFVDTFATNSHFGGQAFALLQKLIWGKGIRVEPVFQDRKTSLVLVTPADKSSDLDSVNLAIIQKGLARIHPEHELPSAYALAWQEGEMKGMEVNPDFYAAFDEYA